MCCFVVEATCDGAQTSFVGVDKETRGGVYCDSYPPSINSDYKKKKKLKEPLTGKLLNCNGKQCNELESLWIKRIN